MHPLFRIPTVKQEPRTPLYRFGYENMDYIEHTRETDKRMDMVIRCLSDMIDFVYFNADHPENQTVRKTNKQTDLIETRLNKGEWEYEESRALIPKILTNLERFAKNVQYDNQMKPSNIKEMLYHKTIRGPKPESRILGKYDDFPSL